MAQNILSAGDLERFPNQGKIERGDWLEVQWEKIGVCQN